MRKILLKIWILTFFMIFVLAISCEKDPVTRNIGKEVEFYILDSFKTESGSNRLIDSTIVLSNEPLISYDQIISYNKNTHTFKLAQSAIDSLNQEGGLKYHFKAFAVTVDKSIIYTGYFWPAYSSSIIKWFVIDPISWSGGDELEVKLAYPSNNFAGSYPDKRNDQRILNVFNQDQKLVN